MPNNTNIISKITLPNSVTYQIKDDTLTADSGIAITSEVNNETFTTTRKISNTGVISVNSKTGNVTLTAEDLGLDKPLNFVGIVTSRESDLSETNIPTISNKESYIPQIGDVIIYNDSGNEYVCIAIDESKTPTEYTWEQFGRNTSVVTQEQVDGNNSNNNYPLLFSPETTIDTIVAKALKNNYLTYNPYTNNLSLERYDILNGVSIYNPGTINGHSFGPAMGKDFIDYDDTLFPNGLHWIGEVYSIELKTGIYKMTENETPGTSSNPGDLVFLSSENSYYASINNGLNDGNDKWIKLVPKSVRPNSDKLITERTLYYYKGNENIDTVGNITKGTWNGDTISVSRGGTGKTSFSRYHILYGNGTDAIQAGPLNWEDWEPATNIGPKAVFKIGDNLTVDSNLKYTSPAIPTATETQSGIVTAVNQHFGGNKFFTGGQLGIKTKNSNLNKIIFGTQPTPDTSEIDYYTSDTNEWASINVTIPSETTDSNREYFIPQFSFKQYGFSTTYDESEKPSYTRGHYEEYLLPEVKIDLTSDKTYTILTSKGTLNGALYATSNDAEPQWGTLPVAQGGTGATTKSAVRSNLEVPYIGGDTFTGNVTIQKNGDTSVQVINSNTNVSVFLDSNSIGNHGVLSYGYLQDSNFVEDTKWMIYRNNNGGEIIVNGNAYGLRYQDNLDTDEKIDNFLEGNHFKIARWTSTNSPGVSNGIILSGAWSNNNYGFQLAIDDDASYYMALRQKGNTSGWLNWKQIPMGDGTGASGTWPISITGHASLDLPLTGGTMTGSIHFSKDSPLIFNFTGGTETPVLVLNNAANYGIRYAEGTPDTMKFSASGNANTNNADLCINGAGDGTVTIRGNTILHAGNYTSYAMRYINTTDATTWTADTLAATNSIAFTRANITGAYDTGHIVWLNAATIGTPFQLVVHDSSSLYFYKRWKSSGTWGNWTKMNAGYADSAGSVAWANITNNPGIFANDVTTYGNIKLTTVKGGYYGITFGTSKSNMIAMSSGQHNGIFVEGKRWVFYYDSTNDRASIGDSSTVSGYILKVAGSEYVNGSLLTTSNITATNGGVFRVDHTGQGAKTKGTAYSAFYLAFKNSANNATYATNPIRYVGTDATDTYNTCVILGSENGTTWVGAGESSSHMPGKIAYNDENLYLSADGSVKIYTSCANDASSYSGPVTISGTTITANLSGNVTGNCSGSSGSCTGNAATATRISGNLGVISSATNCNIWVSSTASADGIPKCVSGVYVTANTGILTAKGFSGPLTGNVTGNCSGNAGGAIVKRLSLTKGTNPSSTQWQTQAVCYQTGSGTAQTDRIGGFIESSITNTGTTTMGIYAYRYTSGSNATNGLNVIIAQDGTCSYSITSPAAFRTALGLGTNATSSTAYLPLAGGTMTGTLTLKASLYKSDGGGINCNNADIINLNSLWMSDEANSFAEGICFVNGSSGWDCMAAARGAFYFRKATDASPGLSAANATADLYAGNYYGNWSGTAVPVAHGGTGATTAEQARSNIKAALKSFTMTTNKSSNQNGNIRLRLDNTTDKPVYVESSKYIVVAAICESTTNRILIPWVYYNDQVWEVKVINAAGGTAFNAVISTALPGNLTFWYYTK